MASNPDDYSPAQKERFAREMLEDVRANSDSYADVTCASNEGHDFVRTSTFTDESGKLIGRFLCTQCHDDAQVELQLDEIDEEPEEWESVSIEDMLEDAESGDDA